MLHPQLAADCHELLQLPQCLVLLNRNAIVPWFILVPQSDLNDLLELPVGQREAVLDEAAAVARFVQQHWKLQKINFAQLGNVVPQMHLHVIGRSSGDNCWPKPVWGNLSATGTYSEVELGLITEQLRKFFTQQNPQSARS